MRTVWKYNLDPGRAPWEVGDGEVLSVTADPQDPALIAVYVELDSAAPAANRELTVTGTGHPLLDTMSYLGTAICPPFAWHVWDEDKAEVPS